jgi:hypothetical protein
VQTSIAEDGMIVKRKRLLLKESTAAVSQSPWHVGRIMPTIFNRTSSPVLIATAAWVQVSQMRAARRAIRAG